MSGPLLTVDDIGRRCTVTLHRGLGSATGTIEAVGRVREDLSIEETSLVELESGELIETSFATIALEEAEL